jgi:hypothetical protein
MAYRVEFVVAVATLASSVCANIGLYEVTIRLIGAFLPASLAPAVTLSMSLSLIAVGAVAVVVDHPFPASAATAAPVNPIAARAAILSPGAFPYLFCRHHCLLCSLAKAVHGGVHIHGLVLNHGGPTLGTEGITLLFQGDREFRNTR